MAFLIDGNFEDIFHKFKILILGHRVLAARTSNANFDIPCLYVFLAKSLATQGHQVLFRLRTAAEAAKHIHRVLVLQIREALNAQILHDVNRNP